MSGLTPAAAAEREMEAIRDDLTRTLDQLKDNLLPSRLAGEALAATRARTPDWLGAYWAVARSPVGLGIIGASAASLAGAILARRLRKR